MDASRCSTTWRSNTCARSAPVGNVALILPGMELVLGQRTVLLRPDEEKVDPRFLTYRLLAADMQYWMRAVANGATVPHLNVEDIRDMPIPDLPPLKTQGQIGFTLSTFDDLIENNRRRIEILEEMGSVTIPGVVRALSVPWA